MTEPNNDKALRAFAGWLAENPGATNAERQARKEELGLTREGPGMVVGVGNPGGLHITTRNPPGLRAEITLAARQHGKQQRSAPSRFMRANMLREYQRSLGQIEDPSDVTIGVKEPPRCATQVVRDDDDDPPNGMTYSWAELKATAALLAWLTAPSTKRHVQRIEQLHYMTPPKAYQQPQRAQLWIVELSAGGYVSRSETQPTYAKAIFAALGAAEEAAR